MHSVYGLDRADVTRTAAEHQAKTEGAVLVEWRFGLPHLSPDWPCFCLQSEIDCGPYGTQWAVWTGDAVERLHQWTRVVGSVWHSDGIRHCLLAGVLPDTRTASAEMQAGEVFETLCRLLEQTGLPMTAMARTWFYNRQILHWYPVFNGVRHRAFNQHGLFTHRVPASTGIGTVNAFGAALTAGAYACSQDAPYVQAVPSPLQCPALAYGSVFSRAIRMETSREVWVAVSGTASIARDGASAHVGDIQSQIELTLQVVHAILADQQMGWAHVRRSIAYVLNADGARAYESVHQRQQLPFEPFVVAVDHICRPELLFEIEVDAVISR